MPLNTRLKPGSSNHILGVMMEQVSKTRMVHIPYRGAGPAMQDMIAGNVQIYFSTIPAALQQVKAGKLRALAVTSTTRVAEIPEMPTVAEAGLPGFQVIGWFGLFAPAATPEPILVKLRAAMAQVMAMPDVQELFAKSGGQIPKGTPAEQEAKVRSDIERWRSEEHTSELQSH